MVRFAALLALVAVANPAAAADRPNVVLVVINGLGPRDAGCYGSTYHRTPHIDRLAREGVRFTSAYAAAPVGGPGVVGVLTGRHPARLGLTDDRPGLGTRPADRLAGPPAPDRFPADAPLLPNVAGPAKYATEYFGPGNDPGRWITAHHDRPFAVVLHVREPKAPSAEAVAKYRAGRPGQQANPVHAARVEAADEAVGGVLALLDEHKLTGRTLVIVTADAGGEAILGEPLPPTTNAPLRDGRGYLYEGGIRVPLIVRGPGVTKPGTTIAVPASTLDVLPTALAACGVTADGPRDGVDLAPALAGGTLPRDALFWHFPHYSPQAGRPAGAVRAGDLKLIESFETGRRELFDLARDPGESRNLAADRPADVTRLTEVLAAWRTAVGAKMPTPNPDYRPPTPAADGTLTLHARAATVDGVQLRFEPLPHKNTLGFWTRKEDTARWEFELPSAGRYDVDVLQGCGRGSGGSEVEIGVGERTLTFTVKDTGGFQAFERRRVGTLDLAAGRQTLAVMPQTKPGAAVMDLREVVLSPAGR